MDNNPNSGSFMANAGGGGGALASAISRRQGALNTQSQGAPGGGSPLPATPPSGSPQMVPQSPSGSTGAAQGGTPKRSDDAHIILNAMAGRLKSQEKIAEAHLAAPATGGF